MLRLVVFFGLLAPATARAACPPGVLEGAFAARLDTSAIPAIQKPLLDMLPPSISLPEQPFLVTTCSACIDDVVLTPHAGTLDLTIDSLDVSFVQGAIELDATASLSLTVGTLDLRLCCAPDASCPAAVSITNAQVHARLEPSVTDCTLDLPITDFTVTVNPYDVAASLDACGLYTDAVSLTMDLLRETIVGFATDELSSIVTTALPEYIGELVNGMFTDGFEMASLRFDVMPESVAINDTGAVMTFSANATPLVGPADCLPKGTGLPSAEPPSPSAPQFSRAMLSVAASRPAIERVLRAAWYVGWLCFDSRDWDLDLGAYLEPLFPDATIDFQVNATSQPDLTLVSTGGGGEVRLAIDELTAALEQSLTGGTPSTATATIKGSLQGDIGIDPTLRAIVVAPTAIDTSDIVIDVPGSSIGFSEESVHGFMQNMVLPMFASGVGAMPVTTSILAGAPLAASLETIKVTSTHVRADLNMVGVDTSDVVPPSTILLSPIANPSGADLVLEMGSSDDTTPRAFLRHALVLDGEPDLDSPRSGERLVVEGLTPGWHNVLVAAVDLNDNEDPTPLDLEIFVDDLPPEVTLTEKPAGMIESADVTIRFAAVDDVAGPSELTYRYTVGAVSRANEPDTLLAMGDLGHATELTVEGLPDRSVIRVTVVARDTAGNEGVGETSFAVEQSPELGCRALGASPLTALALLALALARRQGRRGVRA